MYGKPMISCEIGTGTTFVNLHETTGLAETARVYRSVFEQHR